MFGRESCMRSELYFRMKTLLEEVTANLAFWIFSALHGAAQIFIMFHVISSNVYILIAQITQKVVFTQIHHLF